MTNFEKLSNEQRTRATLQRDVNAVCEETCQLMGVEVTRAVTDVIGELVFKKLKVYATDLEAFAKHAKRSTINVDDVKLLVRRNPSLKEHISKTATPVKEKRRKTISAFVTKKKDSVGTSAAVKASDKTIAVLPHEQAISNEPMNVDDTIDLT